MSHELYSIGLCVVLAGLNSISPAVEPVPVALDQASVGQQLPGVLELALLHLRLVVNFGRKKREEQC